MRKERYAQKLNELEDRIEFLRENLRDKEEFLSSRILRKACYKEFQEAAEIVSDLLAMIVKDSGRFVEDDYTNLEAVSRIIGLEDIEKDLRSVHGLRNVLVHGYNKVDDELAFDSMVKSLKPLREFGRRVRSWLERV